MTLPPFPDGWYFLARSDELKSGTVLTRRLAGEDVVLFRTRSGALAAVRPYCPHLGAHLGHGSKIEGESLQCPMHHFCFDTAGACVRTPYQKRTPPKARLSPLLHREMHGVILVWHSTDGRAPTWEVPDRSVDGFSSLHAKTYALDGHPQETSENSVDLGHLGTLHSFFDVEMTSPLTVDGAYLSASFAFSRSAGVFGRRDAFRASYTAHVHGLGYSFVEVDIPMFGLRTQQYVFATPTDAGRLALTIAMRAATPAKAGAINPLFRLLPERPLRELLSTMIMFGYRSEVERDIAVWTHKRYLDAPALADGDGPIGRYRRWAKQFHPATRIDTAHDLV